MTDLSFADRFGEGRDDNPYWNESVWFSFSIPERRIHGMIQYYFRPNMGMLNGGPTMWDQSGTSQWNCLYYNWSHLQALPAGAPTHLGVVTSRKLGKATVRSRARRLLRECFRLHQADLVQPLDLVLVARPGIRGKTFAEVEQDFLHVLRRAGQLQAFSGPARPAGQAR